MQWSLVVFIVMGQWSSTGGQLCDYRFIGEKKTWKDAQEYCRTHHTDLATVSNETDMQRLKGHPWYQDGAWIGLQGDWHWSQPGVEFNDKDTNWSPGEPNNYKNQENCVVMKNDGRWNDISCDKPYKCICYDENNTSGNRFHVIRSVMNWGEAQNYCRTYYTDLISGVQQLEKFNNRGEFWIGLFKDWSWSDGSSFSFRHWDPNNPDLNPDPDRTCAMTTSGGGGWISDDCSKPKTFFCYDDSVILIQKNLTWVEALYYCRDYHGDLVSITNLDQQLWVQERAKKASTPYVWTGLRYTCTLDFWFWVSDQTVRYTNWNTSEPMGDDCDMSGAMDRGGGHQWVKKIDNENRFNFICSKNSPPQCN